MAVKVIGKDPNHVRKTSCSKCASITAFTMADVEKNTNFIVCPTCSNILVVSGDETCVTEPEAASYFQYLYSAK
jgi:hypothetical protein